MESGKPAKPGRRHAWRRWLHRAFLLWGVVFTLWLANSYRTRGVPEADLQSDATVTVVDGSTVLEFVPGSPSEKAALVFLCGSGVTAQAYAPMLRPIAGDGHAIFVIKLPYRFAPLASHKDAALDRVEAIMADHREIPRWVIAGHSLGAALACRAVKADPHAFSALVLIGTTHPKRDDLSGLTIPVVKVYGTKDGIAPMERMFQNRKFLPGDTRWIEIEGGNHSRFGNYGHQFLDGAASIDREEQQAATRLVLLEALDGDGTRSR